MTIGKTEYPCAVDGCALLAHERRICSICAGNLERDLAEMPALLDDLSVTLSRQARIGGHTNGSRAFERPLPYDPRASEAGDVLRSTLVGWVRELHDGAEYWPVDSLHGMALWLHGRLARLLDHPAAEEAVDEFRFAVDLCKRAIDRPPVRIYAGTCGIDGCDIALYAKPMSPDVDCPGCGHRHSVAERRETMLAALDGMLLTIGEIVNLATYLGDGMERKRTRNLLDKWVERRRITPHSVDREGRPLYPFGETVRAVLATPMRNGKVA
jgi:hypothetical protein